MFYNPKIVIKRIKELQGNESENSLANRLGMPQVTLNYYLSGKRKPSLDLVYRICDVYGSSTDWLLGLSDRREPFDSVVRETKPFENTQKKGKIMMPLCRSVRPNHRTLNLAEISDILCNLTDKITQLETQISALQSTSIATCG